MKKIALFLLISAPFLVSAQGFQVNLQGQKQQGMAAAGAAFIQDGSTAFSNPGGMSFLKQNSIIASVNGIFSSTKYTSHNSESLNKEYKTESPVGTPYSAYAVWGSKDSKFKFALASYVPFGSTVEWEKNWALRTELTKMSLKAIYYQPTVSYKINDKLGIGAGLIVATGSVLLEKDLDLTKINPALGVSGHSKLEGNAKTAYGYNVGVYYKHDEKLSLALTYRSKVKMKLEDGDATFTFPAPAAPAFPSGGVTKFNSELSLPSTLTVGGAYKATQKLTLVLEGSFVGWKCYDSLTFKFNPTSAAVRTQTQQRNYRNTYALRLGAQYEVCDKLAARFGIVGSRSAATDGYVTPENPDANSMFFTCGLGYKINDHFTVDASFLYQNKKRTDKTVATAPSYSGSYVQNLIIPGVSVAYSF